MKSSDLFNTLVAVAFLKKQDSPSSGSMPTSIEKKANQEDDESSSIEVSNLKKHCILGTGELANVYLVTDSTTGKKYALKIFDKLHMFEHTAGFDAVKSMKRESLVLQQICSPFVLQGLKMWQDTTTVQFLLPLVQGGELSKRISDYTSETSEQGLPTDHAIFYSACIAEALAHMHERNIAYRDLKPDNVMLDKKGYCVLIDLGFTKVVVDKVRVLWVPPCDATHQSVPKSALNCTEIDLHHVRDTRVSNVRL